MSGFMKGILAGLGAVAMLFAGLFSGDASAASYSISQGDLLSIYVYRQEDMNVKVRVDNSGYIRFPIAGRINVIGKTPDQIESVIATALRRNGFESPEVVVSVEAFAPRKIFVLGEINAGADFSCTIPEGGEMTAMQAISAAVNTTRNKISHGLVLSFSIILLYRYSSINLYYSTQPA